MSMSPSDTIPYVVQQGDTLQSVANMYRTSVKAIEQKNQGVNLNSLAAGQVIFIPVDSYYAPHRRATRACTTRELELMNLMRLLWEQHVFWTRLVILSMVFDLPDVSQATNRLLRNPQDFKAALMPFYGEETAAEFANLLTQHLTIAAELVAASKENNTAAAADAERRWYQNADEIAEFLGSINPYWSAAEWRSMLREHLAMTKQEAVDFLTKDYEHSISQFDAIERMALRMADVMSDGIIRQFSL
ncbi:MAG: LysM domain-containing protein [[Clostridium] cellulosi]